MRIVFMGTPEFAVPCLERLLQDGHTVPLVVTQADKPKGRGQKLTPPPVKAFALTHDIPVLQPDTLKSDEVQEQLRQVKADVFVVVAYGKILPQAVLEMPPLGCINVHASLLPQYRGAAPIQWAVLNGETQSGVTTMFMDVGLDTGDMLLKSVCDIGENMTAGELHDVLSLHGAQLLSMTLQQLENGTLQRVPQTGESTYASMLDKSMCALDFSKTANELHNQVRGLNPWPTATANVSGNLLKIHQTRVTKPCGDFAPNTVVSLAPFVVSCGDNTALELLEIQAQGGKRMKAEDYFRGHPVPLFSVFSE